MTNKVDYESVIEELRSKERSEILQEILQEIKEGENVKSKRPTLGDDINQTTYSFPEKDAHLTYKISDGKKDEYSIVFLRIANLINNGYSPNIGIFGKSQRGKSETALYILETLHNDLNFLKGSFSPKNQTIYEVVPFLLFYRYNGRVGAMFEEAGETLNKNDYNTDMNHAVAGTLRTQGKKQIPNFFITPEASELDPRIRDNIDIEIEMVGTGKAEITFYERIHGKKAESKRRKYKFGKVSGTWKVPRASKKIREEYNEIDSSYKGRYLDKMLKKAIQATIEKEEGNKMLEF